jgi:hypothetical protein
MKMANLASNRHPETQPLPIRRMRPMQRWLFGIAGVTMATVAGIGLFTTANDLSVAAGLALGSVLFALSAIGLVPLRARAREIELDFAGEVAGDIADVIVDFAETEGGVEIAERLADSLPTDVAGLTTQRIIAGMAYKASVLSALERVLQPPIRIRADVTGPSGRRIDAIVQAPRKKLNVEIKHAAGKRSAPKRLLEAISQAQSSKGDWLIVMNQPIPRAIGTERVSVVKWLGDQDDDALRAAVEARLPDRAAVEARLPDEDQ